MNAFAKLRDHMVDDQLVRRGISDERVLRAMRTVPRERFVREGCEALAYRDLALAIEENQSISQPYIVAVMIEAAGIAPGDRVLEVGAGSGYAAAVLGQIAGRVFAIERHETLAALAAGRMAALGYDNVEIRVGDGTEGLPQEAPFAAILVAAGGPAVPPALREQLAVGGHLVMPVGERDDQTLCNISRIGTDRFEDESLGAVMFVPLIGAQGWHEDGTRATRPLS